MDKSWIAKPRNSNEYIVGLKNFLDFAFQHGAIENSKIICPCPSCGFHKWHARKDVRDHLLYKPFPKNYVVWNFHGEKEVTEFSTSAHVMRETLATEHPLDNMVNDAFGIHMDQESGEDSGTEDFVNDEPRENRRDFDEFIKEGNQKLQEGSDFTKLEFIVKLYHIKVLCGLSDKAITMILELVKDAFSCVNLPTTFDQAKKLIRKLSLDYVKIDACPNDCMLFEDEDPNNIQQTCSHCGASRWNSKKKKKKKQAAKVLRYFPLKPRLQRLFMCRKTAEHMLWHATGKGENDKMVHPRDGEAWKTFDLTHREFGLQPRNVRLGLVSDGFNPYRSMSSTHSIWPIFLIPYNLPPWMCMKHTSFILSMVIPGKHSLGNNIDIYLKPLVRELKELWDEGMEIYDASEHKMFKIHAALIWTVSDFPGLSMLSGWNTYTGLACPTCNFDAKPCYLNHSKKWCYIGHRRFLGRQHRFRLSRVRFDGHTEERDLPAKLSGSEILAQVENLDVTFGKKEKLNKKGKRGRQATMQWRKRSIFFELPYWKTNLLRHNLDFMHIEKNVCDNILYTLLNEKSKAKDNLNVRKDLQDMGIRRDLWPDDNGKYHLALYSLTRDAKKVFLVTLKNVRVPDGYSSNISRCIDEAQQKIIGLKSHDCHILIEQLLPLAICNVLPNQVTSVLIEFCSFFRILCGKSLSRTELDKLQDRIVITLCHLEMLFPPSFFTVMVHLTVHLVEEAKLGGPVHYRYMYPIERYNNAFPFLK
nr:uncharacterized protein LOC112757838 [Arachis hypogaea]